MSVKDAPLRRAVRESLTDTLACSITMEEGEGAPAALILSGDVFTFHGPITPRRIAAGVG